MKRKISSLVLVLCMLAAAFPSTAFATQTKSANFSTNYKLSGDGAADIVAVATAQLGKTGSALGYTEQWCADFVMDCARLAGQSNAIPYHSGIVTYMVDKVASAGGKTIKANGSIVTNDAPKVGDLVVYDWDNTGYYEDHVEIIYKVSGSTFWTIGGNTGSGGSVSTRKVSYRSQGYTIGNRLVYRVVRPNYTTKKTVPTPGKPTIKQSTSYLSTSSSYTLSWGKVANAASYRYYISRFPTGYAYTTNERKGTVTGTSVTLKNLPNGWYSAFVHAVNSAGVQGAQSNVVSFYVYNKEYVRVATTTYNGHLYALYDTTASWYFAKNLCERMGGTLATITSKGEESAIEALIGKGSRDSYWLGGNNLKDESTANTKGFENKGSWHWATGESFSYTNWRANEPNGAVYNNAVATTEHFLEIRKSYGNKWNDAKTQNQYGFILEIDLNKLKPVATSTVGNSTYTLYDANLTWMEAQDFCTMQGGHLVNISSAAEDSAVMDLIKKGGRSWYYMGGKKVKKTTWQWTDGTGFGSYTNWRSANDTLGIGSESYLMKYKNTGKWIGIDNLYYPAKDTYEIGFVMEKETASPGKILQNPQSVIAKEGDKAELRVKVSGVPQASDPGDNWKVSENGGYSWMSLREAGLYSSCSDSGNTSAESWIQFKATKNLNNYVFRYAFTDGTGATVTSKTARITVMHTPDKLADCTVKEGEYVHFSADGNIFDKNNSSYGWWIPEWQVSKDNGKTWTAAKDAFPSAYDFCGINGTSGRALCEFKAKSEMDGVLFRYRYTGVSWNLTEPDSPITAGVNGDIYVSAPAKLTVTSDSSATGKTLKLSAEKVAHTLKAGDTVNVKVNADRNTGYAFGGVIVTWDKSALELTKVAFDANKAPDNASAEIENSGSYLISFGDYLASSDRTATGTFFTLTFRITDKAKEGSYTIGLKADKAGVNNAALETVQLQTASGSVTLSKVKVLIGDVNDDGVVNRADAAILNRYLANWKNYDKQIKNWDAADVNVDGQVNRADAAILSRYLANWKTYDKYFK